MPDSLIKAESMLIRIAGNTVPHCEMLMNIYTESDCIKDRNLE